MLERVQVDTPDGHALEADVAVPVEPHAGVVLCHPHPQYGGTRHDHVVDRLFRALPDVGLAVLRFDFRGAYGGGIDERIDVVAALDVLADRVPGVPLHLVGYSFGASVALGVHDDRLASHVLVAPPLGVGLPDTPPPRGRFLLVVAEHDQFCPPDAVGAATAGWPTDVGARIDTVPMADHFFAGRTDAVVASVTRWLATP